MSEPKSLRENMMSKIMAVALLAVVAYCIPAFLISTYQKTWERGVFWGAEAIREGANYSNQLETAYRLDREAGERVKANKQRLNKYRTISE